MELRQLRYFVAVADALNFSRAAESLFVSQSSLSQQIAELEREVGLVLLKRTKRSVELTDAGKKMLPLSRNLLINAEKLVPEVRHSTHVETSDQYVSIGLDNSFDLCYHKSADGYFRVLLTDAIHLASMTRPGLIPNFGMYEHEKLVRELDTGSIDLGFFMHHSKTITGYKDYIAQILGKDEMVLVLRSGEDIEDTQDKISEVLHNRGLILLEQETKVLSQIMRMLNSIGVEPHIRFCKNRLTIALLVECGELMTIMPKSIFKGLNNPALKCLHFRTPFATRYLLAVWLKDNQNSIIQSILLELEKNM